MNNEEYLRIINELVTNSAAEIIASKHDSAALVRAMENYLRQGRAKSLSIEELVDFFGVSSDCVLDRSGLTDEESMDAMRLFGEMCDSIANDWD